MQPFDHLREAAKDKERWARDQWGKEACRNKRNVADCPIDRFKQDGHHSKVCGVRWCGMLLVCWCALLRCDKEAT